MINICDCALSEAYQLYPKLVDFVGDLKHISIIFVIHFIIENDFKFAYPVTCSFS